MQRAAAILSVAIVASANAEVLDVPIKDAAMPLARQYDPKNNEADCSPDVRRAISQARKSPWGEFDFTCIEGSVRGVFVSTSSRIVESLVPFVNENLRLFGVVRSSVDFSHARGGAQLYGRNQIAGHGASRLYLYDPSTQRVYFRLKFRLADTSAWNLSTEGPPEIADRVSSDSVYREAMRQWGLDPLEASSIESKSEIRVDGCGDGKPALIQYTRVREYHDYPKERRVFYGVRVIDGKPCNDLLPKGEL